MPSFAEENIRERWVEYIKSKLEGAEADIVNMEDYEKNMLPRDLQVLVTLRCVVW